MRAGRQVIFGGGCSGSFVGWVRIRASVSSVGMPRSITHTRLLWPYWVSIFERQSASVVLSLVLPGITSSASGKYAGVTIKVMTT